MKKLYVLLVLLILSACTHQDGAVYAPSTDADVSTTEEIKTANSDFDLTDTWDKNSATTIVFAGETAQINGAGAALAENTLRIDAKGTYVLQGEFSGNVQVALAKTEKAHLILNGASIRSKETAAICISSADKVVITLAEGTENILRDRKSTRLSLHDALPISLTVYGNSNNGIGTKNDLKIVSGNLTISASKNALKGNDSVHILNGSISVVICSDGVKSDNESEQDKGVVSISGGTLDLNCTDDGIQAVTGVTITENASVKVHAADKTVNCDGPVRIDEGCLTIK